MARGRAQERVGGEGEISTDDAVTRRRVGQLLDERRKALPRDRHVTDHTHLDQNDDKIVRRVEKVKATGETETRDTNLTKLLGAAPSTSSNREILEIETELANEGVRVNNPHIPATDEILETIEEWCEERAMTPAWEIVSDRLEVSDE